MSIPNEGPYTSMPRQSSDAEATIPVMVRRTPFKRAPRDVRPNTNVRVILDPGDPNPLTAEEIKIVEMLVTRLRDANIGAYTVGLAELPHQGGPGLFLNVPDQVGATIQMIPRLYHLGGVHFEVICSDGSGSITTWDVPVVGYDWFVQALIIVANFHHPRLGH